MVSPITTADAGGCGGHQNLEDLPNIAGARLAKANPHLPAALLLRRGFASAGVQGLRVVQAARCFNEDPQIVGLRQLGRVATNQRKRMRDMGAILQRSAGRHDWPARHGR
jgi:hypothetical protein